jgi:toxin-antitoxin system PIN domain toxin
VILLDVNVLVAAYRADHPHHDRVRPWFDGLVGGQQRFTVPGVAWASFIRLVTNRRIFTVPSPGDDAFSFLRSVRAQPNHVALSPSERHLGLFEGQCGAADATGDLAVDAYLVAIAMDLGCEVVSLDRDFARFPSVRWLLPGG